MKSRVETRHLGQIGKPAMKCLDQQNLVRHVFRIEWTKPAQFFDHFRSEALRLVILWTAVHDTVTYRGQRIAVAVFLDPIRQNGHCRCVIRCFH